jgi:hypothetical protein
MTAVFGNHSLRITIGVSIRQQSIMAAAMIAAVVSLPLSGAPACSTGAYPRCEKPTVYTVDASSTPAQINALLYQHAERGDEVRFQAGAVWDFNEASFHMMIPKAALAGTGSGYLTLTTTEAAKLPAEGTRITPAYKPLLPTFQGTAGWPILSIAADHVKLRGLRFRPNPSQASRPRTTQSNTAVYIGRHPYWTGSYANRVNAVDPLIWEARLVQPVAAAAVQVRVDTTARLSAGMRIAISGRYGSVPAEVRTIQSIDDASTFTLTEPVGRSYAASQYVRIVMDDTGVQPDDVVVQHCIFDNETHTIPVSRFIMYSGRTTVIRDSYFDDAWSRAQDAQLILSIHGTGPVTIENNYLSGASENIMFGGGPPKLDIQVDSASIKYNWLGHPLERDRPGPWKWLTAPDREGGRVVFAGRMVFPSSQTSGLNWFMATNTGMACETEPSDADWGAVPLDGTIQDCGVTWKRTGPTTQKLIKNNFELKAGRNITVQYNVMRDYPATKAWNGTQAHIINIKSNSADCWTTTQANAGKVSYPDCYQARTSNVRILNNVFRTQAGGLSYIAGQASKPAESGNFTFADNLIVQTENPFQAPFVPRVHEYSMVSVGTFDDPTSPVCAGAAGSCGYQQGKLMEPVVITNNTWVSQVASQYPYMFFSSDAPAFDGTKGLGGDTRFVGNIGFRGTAGAWGATSGDGGAFLARFPCAGSANCNKTQWDRNILLGAPNVPGTNWPEGTVFTGCPSTAACRAENQSNGPAESKLFRNPAAGDYSVRDTHRWSRQAGASEVSVGADTSQLPDIRRLTITPTDRSVLFRWSVTQPIAHIPCVIEVHTSPDLEGDYKPDANTTLKGVYAGETGQIATFHGQDADDHDRNIRRGLERMLLIGYSVPLVPSTKYFYRLHCGGPVERGSFTTTAAAQGRATQTITRQGGASVKKLEVEYGTEYSRGSDAIAKPQIVSAACEGRQSCTVSFEAARSSIIYYRWRERDAAGKIVQSGDVSTLVVN